MNGSLYDVNEVGLLYEMKHVDLKSNIMNHVNYMSIFS